ncbi:MAG: FkbM family methyltransferase, partial [Thermodesulfobacteriota bacterium]
FERWEDKRWDLISFFIPRNPVIVQAGASYGDETVQLALKWPQSYLIAFEPNPHSFETLSQKVADFNNIHIHNLALNYQNGKAPFYVCYGTTGRDLAFEHASSLLKPSKEMEIHYKGPVINIECAVLDDWCRQNKIDHVDLLRLDLQGSELQVLCSSPQILSTVKVIHVATNFFPFRIGTTRYQELETFLKVLGFRLLSHWYREGLQGSAIFVKDEGYEWNGKLYQKCHVKGLDAHFYVDDIPDGIKSYLRKGIYWEGTIGNYIKKFTKEGTIAVDIGAHIGIHTITMSRKVGPKGAVIAFEPQKKIYAEHRQNLRLNGCNNVVSLRKAVGDGFATVQMSIRDPVNEGGTSIGEGGDEVEMVPLDSLNLHPVSFIKVDVEHFEYYVFQGARETILRNKPVIIFEVMGNFDYATGSDEVKAQFDRVIELVKSFGYKVHSIFGNDYIAFPLELDFVHFYDRRTRDICSRGSYL